MSINETLEKYGYVNEVNAFKRLDDFLSKTFASPLSLNPFIHSERDTEKHIGYSADFMKKHPKLSKSYMRALNKDLKTNIKNYDEFANIAKAHAREDFALTAGFTTTVTAWLTSGEAITSVDNLTSAVFVGLLVVVLIYPWNTKQKALIKAGIKNPDVDVHDVSTYGQREY